MRHTSIVNNKERDTPMPCETKVETGQTDRQEYRQTRIHKDQEKKKMQRERERERERERDTRS